MANSKNGFSEDLFADTRMTFGEHLEDLRKHLLRALYGLLLGLFVSFFFAHKVVQFIQHPVEQALREYHIEYYKNNPDKVNLLMQDLLRELRKDKPDPALQELNKPQSAVMSMAPADLDRTMRQLYPQAYQEGGPLKDAVRPKDDAAALDLKFQIKPVDFIDALGPAMGLLGKRHTLTTLSAQEGFMVYFKVALLSGLVITSPWVFYQIWMFVAAGLYPQEKKYVTYYMPFSIFLFLGGAAVCQFIVVPAALKALLAFNMWMNVEPDLRLNEWLGFAILMPVVFGVSFQTPLVMLFLEKVGIFSPEDFAKKRRMAIFVIAIFSAIVTPSVDYVSMLFLLVPMVGLYEFGIILTRYSRTKRQVEDEEVPYEPEKQEAEGSTP